VVRLAVAGAGYWGINHVRAAASLRSARLVAVADPSDAARARAARLAPSARLETEFDAILAAADVDAVILATPARDHAAQAVAALDAGKHVLVEKPLALSTVDALRVQAAAERAKKTLMVGHLMLFHPAFERLQQLVRDGELGALFYAYALRVNLGRLRCDENALWSLGPHDVSMVLELFRARPATVAARGQAYLQPNIEDVVFLNLAFADGKMAQVQLSWLDPHKERRLTVVGAKKMVVFDDASTSEKLRIYDKGYERPPSFTQFGEYLTIRQGDIHIPRVDMSEPLERELSHFVASVRDGTTPRTDAAHAVEVVRVLEAGQRSLMQGGVPIALS
jgi:predicted dehydrogenase